MEEIKFICFNSNQTKNKSHENNSRDNNYNIKNEIGNK